MERRHTVAPLSAITVRSRDVRRGRQGLRIVKRILSADRLNAVGIGLVLVLTMIAVFGPLMTARGPLELDLPHRMAPPSSLAWFGTDDAGRDVLSRVLWGMRLSLTTAIGIVGLAVLIGGVIGLLAAYVGGWIDEILMRFTDMFLAFPALVLAMGLAAALGGSILNAMVATALVWWPWFARLVRGHTLYLRNQAFVEAALVLGASNSRIVVRHILPNTLGVLIVQASLSMGYAILTMASLGFIGLGAQPPAPELGTMVASYQAFYLEQWWLVTFPGLAIMLWVIAFNLLGEGLRQAIAPRLQRGM